MMKVVGIVEIYVEHFPLGFPVRLYRELEYAYIALFVVTIFR